MHAYDLVALGETMLALSPPAGRSVRDAAALLVDQAGAESNTCVGLARLGFQVAFCQSQEATAEIAETAATARTIPLSFSAFFACRQRFSHAL